PGLRARGADRRRGAMTALAIVIVAVVVLALVVIVSVGRDPGAARDDVAVGYVCALARGDFDAMYRMIDPDLLRGRNRIEWVDGLRNRPHPVYDPRAVYAREARSE